MMGVGFRADRSDEPERNERAAKNNADRKRTTFCASYHQFLSVPTDAQFLRHIELGMEWLRAEEIHEESVRNMLAHRREVFGEEPS